MPDLQEIIALLVVAVVAWNLFRRRPGKKTTSCSGCAPPKNAGGEATLKFYRRVPPAEAPSESPDEQGPDDGALHGKH